MSTRHTVVFVSLLLSLVLSLGRPATALAQAEDENRFVFIVPPGFETGFIDFWGRYGADLEASFDFFEALYGVTPPLPLYVRVYEDREEILDLNLLVPPLPENATHTHLGAREIALIAPLPPDFYTSDQGLSAMRLELNSVFLSTLAENNLPGGLELGISQYVALTGPRLEEVVARLAAAQATDGLYSWRTMMDNPIVYAETEVAHPQALGIAAYLADRFGFLGLVRLVGAIGQGQGVEQALVSVYGEPMDRLEQDWLRYLPEYLDGRWQYNALTEFDLAPFEAALEAGAYTQVAQGLEAVLPFLQATGQAEAQAAAQALIATAQRGMAAGSLVQQARAALEGREYERTLGLVDQARAAYAELGSPVREAELVQYEARAREVLDLRAQLAAATRRFDAGETEAAEAQLIALVPRLEAVGDNDNAGLAEGLVELIYRRKLAAAAERTELARRAVWGFLAVLGVVALHQLARGLYRLRRKPQPGVL
jgi:hypothetical protein